MSVYTNWLRLNYDYTPAEDGKSTKSMWDSQADVFHGLSTPAARCDDEWRLLFWCCLAEQSLFTTFNQNEKKIQSCFVHEWRSPKWPYEKTIQTHIVKAWSFLTPALFSATYNTIIIPTLVEKISTVCQRVISSHSLQTLSTLGKYKHSCTDERFFFFGEIILRSQLIIRLYFT